MIGVAGMGGILIDPKGKNELSYAWGLGIFSNNQTKAYALLQGPRMTLIILSIPSHC